MAIKIVYRCSCGAVFVGDLTTHGVPFAILARPNYTTLEEHLETEGNEEHVVSPVYANSASTGLRKAPLLWPISEPQKDTGSGWHAAAMGIWPGSDAIGMPRKIRILMYVISPGSHSCGLRIVDVEDDSNTVCEVSGIDNTELVRLDMGDLDNISATQTIWEIQTNTSGGGIKPRPRCVIVEF